MNEHKPIPDEIEKLIGELRRLAGFEAYGLETTTRPWHMHEGDFVNSEHRDVYAAESEGPDTLFLLFAVNNIERFADALEAQREQLKQARKIINQFYQFACSQREGK
jgi:hypothetical protein